MSWYKVLSEPEEFVLPSGIMRFSHIERLSSVDTDEMGLIGQFFVAPRVLIDGRTPVQISLYEDEDREIVLQQIAPHFMNCKIIHFHGETKTVGILTGVKPASQELFLRLQEEGTLHPLIADLFRSGKSRSEEPPSAYTLYEINKESVGFADPEGFHELWNLLLNTFVRDENHFTVVPRGWEFGEHVTQSLYLRALNSVCSKIRLYVNPESNLVTAISGVM